MISIVEKARDALKGTFLKSAEEANEVAKAIKRKRKFTPSTLAQAFILALLQNPKASHADIASVAAVSGVDVSPQAVEQRYSKSLAAFFKALFELGASDRLKCRLVASSRRNRQHSPQKNSRDCPEKDGARTEQGITGRVRLGISCHQP